MSSKYDRTIEAFSLSELDGVNVFFKRLSGIDPDDVPAKYGDCVALAQRLIAEKCTARIVYRRLKVDEIKQDSVILSDDDSNFELNGAMAAKVLTNAAEMYAFVLTIDGYENIPTSDIMVEYMMDTWGSAYAECAQAKLAQHITELAADEGKIRTHVWCPGQFKFDLRNQTALFNILKPEDIHCRLTDRLMMVPVKSASGIIGLLEDANAELIKPCDYCQHRSTCPASSQGCAAL